MKHIVIEGNCFYGIEESENKTIPKCCKLGPGEISINCLKLNGKEEQYCPFLSLQESKSN